MAVQPSLPLRLLVEQTVPRDVIVCRCHSFVALPAVRAEDGLVWFEPILSSHSSGSISLTLSLKSLFSVRQTMLHCEIVVNFLEPKLEEFEQPEPLRAEARIFLDKSYSPYTTVVRLENIGEKSLKRATIIYRVYDLVAARPVTGAGLHLNRARLQGAHCDVKLVVEGVELAAHRAVLAARSPVLDKMLSGDFKEAREGRVELVGVSATAVEKFIEFLYTDHIEDWGTSELELLLLADRYMVPELRDACSLSLWKCKPLRALEILHDAGLCDTVSGQLRRRLTATVLDNLKCLADTEEWAVFSATYPVLVDSMLGPQGTQPSDHRISMWSL